MTESARAARVTIARQDPADIGQRQVIVAIDDGEAAKLAFGDSITLDIAPGDHVLKANNTLVWRKVSFRAEAGADVRFLVANRASRFTLGFLTLMGVAPLRMTVERTA
jgi:hypothetical protein